MMQFLLLVPIVVVIAYSVHSGVKYTRMISHIFLSLVYRPKLEPVTSSRGEKITILDSSDREIDAVFVENKQSDVLVIFCSESGADKASWEKYAYFLPDMGFSILSINFRNKTKDGEEQFLSQWPVEEDVNEVLTVVRWAKHAMKPGIKIVLFGVSKGADIALAASFHDPSIKVVIADGLFSMKEIFRDYIRKWGPILVKPNLFGEKYPDWVVYLFTDLGLWYSQKKSLKKFLDVEKCLSKKHVPLLMIHGEEDDYVPASHQRLLEKINSHKTAEHLIVHSAGHNEAVLVSRKVYEDKIIQFLKKNL